jgi:hypothetical protein
MEPGWIGWPAIALIESLKIQGDDLLFCFFPRRTTASIRALPAIHFFDRNAMESGFPLYSF